MIASGSTAEAKEALHLALEQLAAFDASALVHEDGSANEEAQAALRRLQQRVDAAVAKAEPA